MNLSTHSSKLTVPVVQAINMYEYTVANRNLQLDTPAFLRLHGIDSYTLTEKNILICVVLGKKLGAKFASSKIYNLKVGTNENGSACGRWLSIGI
jgi:hypothetical protein